MTVWKYPLSRNMVQRSMIAALSAVLLMTPLQALAADEAPQAEASPMKTPSSIPTDTTAFAQFTGNPADSLVIGEHRLISRKEIDRHWDGLDPDYTPEKSIEAVKALLSEEDFEALFPYRLGSAAWFNVAKGKEYYKADQTDYFSYDNLIHAVAEVSNLKIKIRTRQGAPSAQEIYRLDKDARVETLVVRSADFYSAENLNQAIETVIIDGGTFLKEGFKKDRKRELAAFLANLSHETGGAGLPLPAARFAGDCSGTKTSPAGQGSTWMPSLIRQAQSCIPDRRTSAIMGGDRSCSAGTSTTDSSAPLSMGIKACCWTIPRSLPPTARSAT